MIIAIKIFTAKSPKAKLNQGKLVLQKEIENSSPFLEFLSLYLDLIIIC